MILHYLRESKYVVFEAQTALVFKPTNNLEEAGICIYLNHKHHYEIALTQLEDQKYLILRRQIGSLWKIENQIPFSKEEVILVLKGDKDYYTLGYMDQEQFITLGIGESAYLTTEVGGKFTGNYIGLYATGNGNVCTSKSIFKWFSYDFS